MRALCATPLIDEILDAQRDRAAGVRGVPDPRPSTTSLVYRVVAAPMAETGPRRYRRLPRPVRLRRNLDYIEPSIKEAGPNCLPRDRTRGVGPRVHAHTLPSLSPVPTAASTQALCGTVPPSGLGRPTQPLVKGRSPPAAPGCGRCRFGGGFRPEAVARLALGWLPRHPFRPAPVFRGGAPCGARVAADRAEVAWSAHSLLPREAMAKGDRGVAGGGCSSAET